MTGLGNCSEHVRLTGRVKYGIGPLLFKSPESFGKKFVWPI